MVFLSQKRFFPFFPFFAVFICTLFFLTGCNVSENQIKKVLKENPNLVFDSIKENPNQFFEAIKVASIEERKRQQEENLQRQLKNPKKPVVKEGRAYFGNKDALVTIFEYSDFQCPYCARAARTVEQIMKEYGEKVRLVYKHYPFKEMGLPTAKYYEALAVEGAKKKDYSKVKEFHDKIFEDQRKLSIRKEKFLEDVLKGMKGVNLAKIKKLAESSEVNRRIQSDIEEAKKFGVNGTPNFIIGGVLIPGAVPFEEMKRYVEMALKNKEGKK